MFPVSADPQTLTLYLNRLRSGDATAEPELLPLVYDELRALAAHLLRAQRPDHTLQPTALVHEAWLKLERAGSQFDNRAHFVAVAAKAMRQILVNHARDRRAAKRGGDAARQPLDDCLAAIELTAGDVVALDDALAALAAHNARHAQIVEMRVFGGMSVDEVAQALGVGETTVKVDWRFARAWLQQRLVGAPPPA